LDREQFGPLPLLTRTPGECLQRLAVAIDAGDGARPGEPGSGRCRYL
jgi:hypothetical protein